MIRKTLTPIALGFAALVSIAACGGGDDALEDTGLADTGMGAMPAPAPAPLPDTAATDTMPTDTTGDTTRRDTARTTPPGT